MHQWKTLLKSLGLTDSEAKIYLLSLETGPCSVQDLAKKANVSRVTTYAAIETLSTHGLMSNVQKGKKTFYAAEAPERLISFVQMRLKKLEGTLHEVESIISELKLIQRGEKPVVRMYEGLEGLRAVNADILSGNPDYIYEMTNRDALLALFDPEEFVPAKKEMSRRKVGGTLLYTASAPYTPGPNITGIPIPKDAPPFFGSISIGGNRVTLSSLRGKNISVLIESQIIADAMRTLFKLAITGAQKK